MTTHQEWKHRAENLPLDGRAFIAGQRCAAASNETFGTLNPSTGKVLADVTKCDAKDIDRAVVAAREAFESGVWSKAAPSQRKAVLQRLAQLIDENAEELALLEALEE
jgi:gamma-glutamyl-gamma-aminobutyraldehyde dehydrogenase